MMEDAKEKEKKSVKQIYISILALTLMNVSIIAGIGNDVQRYSGCWKPFHVIDCRFLVGSVLFRS